MRVSAIRIFATVLGEIEGGIVGELEEDFLVRVDDNPHNAIEYRADLEEIDCGRVDSMVVHGRFNVRVGHTEPLRDVHRH